MKLKLTGEIWQEGNMYVAYCPELDISSCGKSVEEARKNLIEAIKINIEETKKMGTFEQFMKEAGFDLNEGEVISLRKKLVAFEQLAVNI